MCKNLHLSSFHLLGGYTKVSRFDIKHSLKRYHNSPPSRVLREKRDFPTCLAKIIITPFHHPWWPSTSLVQTTGRSRNFETIRIPSELGTFLSLTISNLTNCPLVSKLKKTLNF